MVVGIGWYDRAQWTKLKQVAADADVLDDTYEDWLRGAERMEREVARPELTVRRVTVDVDSLLAWCADRQKRLDGAARSEYVTELLRGS
jgi:hypothetical protein